jgi:hypothetical protein
MNRVMPSLSQTAREQGGKRIINKEPQGLEISGISRSRTASAA